MALLDVTELMTDPDFCDSVTGTRRAQHISVDGIASTTDTTFSFVGSVQHVGNGAIAGQLIKQFPDLTNISASILIYTTHMLQTQGDTYLADLITWQGDIYVVTNVVPWNNWGAGWYAAVCVLRDLVPVQ